MCQRVLLIANMLGMEHEEAARLAGLSRSAAYEWHNRYEEDGIEGLRDRRRRVDRPRVDVVTSARFKERIVAGAALGGTGWWRFVGSTRNAYWRRVEIDCSLSSTTGYVSDGVELVWRRGCYPQADATAQAAFSQRLDCN